MTIIKRTLAVTAAIGAIGLATATSASAYDGTGVVPGQQGRGGTVTGHYVTTDDGAKVIVNYRGDFGGDPYLNDGWITNQYKYPDGRTVNYLIVYKTDPRWTGNPDLAIWGEWEIVKQTKSGEGNQANIQRPTYDPTAIDN